MELSTIIPHIEALIFASDKPLTGLDIVELINNAFGFMEERITLDQVEASIEGIREKYDAEFYPFEVRESGGGYQFLTKKDFHKTVGQLNGDKFLKRLSNAALETLAIIAYKQPITKGEVEAIRGVNSDYSVQKLLEKELIVISGRNENLPGKPLVYATSKTFMDYFGINTTDDLPKIKEVLAEQMVEATVINDAMNKHVEEEDRDIISDENGADILPFTSEEGDIIHAGTTLIVADNGELIEQPLDTNMQQADEATTETNGTTGLTHSSIEPSTNADEPNNLTIENNSESAIPGEDESDETSSTDDDDTSKRD